MDTTKQRLESLFDAVRALPDAAQEAAVAALSDIARMPYPISDEEWAILAPALDRVGRGEFADDAAIADLLDTPWRN